MSLPSGTAWCLHHTVGQASRILVLSLVIGAATQASAGPPSEQAKPRRTTCFLNEIHVSGTICYLSLGPLTASANHAATFLTLCERHHTAREWMKRRAGSTERPSMSDVGSTAEEPMVY